MKLLLPDPRHYPKKTNSNLIIHSACELLKVRGDEWLEHQRLLKETLVDLLSKDDALPISVALAMSPSQAVYTVIWNALRCAVEESARRRAIVFALPCVFVVGSKTVATLPDHIADVDGLNRLLRQHGVFSDHASVFLSGKWLHPSALAAMTPSQLYHYTHSLADAARGVPLPLNGSAVTVKGEGVFLRYLLGVAMHEANTPMPIQCGGDVGAWGSALMAFLSDALKTEGVTLFPIARPPEPVMQAMVVGNRTRLDIALQVFASTLIRRIREAQGEPVAILSAHNNHEVHVTLSALKGGIHRDVFRWPLSPLDSVSLIEQNVRELMAECHVNDVRIVPTVEEEATRFTPDDVPPCVA